MHQQPSPLSPKKKQSPFANPPPLKIQNHDAIKQLPFLGKKTVPASLRKDLWLPLAVVEFPKPTQGLIAYRKLREFRRLHETTYPYELITQTEGRYKGHLMSTKQRGKALMNQKANTVADLAAVLLQQERGPTPEQADAIEKRRRKAESLKKIQKGKKKAKKMNPVPVEEMVGVEGVKVRWANPLDAEYAETWPPAVVHDGFLQRSRYTAAFPQMDATDGLSGFISEGEVEGGGGGVREEGDLAASQEEAASLVSPPSSSSSSSTIFPQPVAAAADSQLRA